MKTNKRSAKRGHKGRQTGAQAENKQDALVGYPVGTTIIKLVQEYNISSNGSGVCSGVIYMDPGASYANITEYGSDMANIFTNFRFLQTRVRFLTSTALSLQESKTGHYGTLAVGFQNRGTTGMATPTTYVQVLDNSKAKLWAVCNDTSAGGLVMTRRITGLEWLGTGSSGSPDYAGAPGGFQYYGSNFAVSVPIFQAFQEVWYQFRTRS